MPTAITHIGELVSEDINQRFRSNPKGQTPLNRGHIEKVTLILPSGEEMLIPVEARVITEY